MNPLLAKAEALQAVAVPVLIVALAVGSYFFGRHVKAGEVAARDLKQQQTIQRLQDERQAKADELALLNAARRAEAAPREKVITKEVTRYVQVTPADQRCTLPGTWRVRHDAAATGVPFDAGAGSLALATDAPIDDAAALATVAGNYAVARECAAKLEGWIRRYREVELNELKAQQ